MLSKRIILFLANLPQFHHEQAEGEVFAVRLTDGTAYVLPSEPEAQERGLLLIRWAGKVGNESIAIGSQIAKLEIVDAVDYWLATGEHKNRQEAVKFMFDHYEFKTGDRLNHYSESESAMANMVRYLAKELGVETLKKLLGF